MRAIAAACLGLVLAACSGATGGGGPTAVLGDPSGTGTVGRARIDSEEHARIVAAYGGIYRNPQLEQALVPIVGRIVAASDRPDRSYRITILNAPAVNAFALPDGYLYVTRGLLALAGDSSEVAAVLAHEIAHVTANHAAARQDKARDAIIVSQVVTDVLKDDEGGQLALASSQRSLAAFSRQQELEADAIGIRTIGTAGYDPYAATRFLAAMAEYAAYRASLTMQDGRPDFLATHPSTPERVQFAAQAAEQFGIPETADLGRDRYLDGIDGMVFGDDPAQGFVRDRNFYHPGLRIGFTVPTGFVIDNTSEAVLATGGDGTALRFDAVGLNEGADLAAYLRSGWVNGLDETSLRSFSVNGLAAAMARAEAKGWFFEIVVIQTGGRATYRFIFANEAVTDAFTGAVSETVESFRSLSDAEVESLRPLHVRIVTATAADTEATMVARMRGVDGPQQLFRLLNDFSAGDRIGAGERYKIITDG
jgi:predicted Zn-dependent protease